MTKLTFEEIVEEYSEVIKYSCLRYVNKIKCYDYNDLYQECLMKLFSSYQKYNGNFAYSTFIKNVCNNHLYNLRRNSRTQERMNHIDGKPCFDTNKYHLNSIIKYDEYNKYEADVFIMGDYVLERYENGRDKEIIERILYGETRKSISLMYGISVERVRQIFKEFTEKVKMYLQE